MPTWSSGLLPGVVALTWAAALAAAQGPDRPLTLPTGDVAVVYRFEGVGEDIPHKLLVTYTGQGERVRIDYFRFFEAKSPYLSLIFDRPANRVISLHPESRSYLDRPIGTAANPGAMLPLDADFTRLGQAVVAHAQCIDWMVTNRDKPEDRATACVTEDGIMLRLASTKPKVVTLTATEIHYGPPAAGLFDLPPKFTREALP